MKGESEKRKAKKKKHLITIISTVSSVFVLILVLVIINAYVFPLNYLSTLVSLPSIQKRASGELVVHFVDVGQGDATIIEFPDGKTMLIDGGGEDCTHLLRYIRALKIKELDYLMLSHPDTDHCGGLDDVLKLYGAKEIYMPYCPNERINDAYYNFTKQVKKKAKSGTKIHISQKNSLIHSNTLDDFYYATILSPLSVEFDDSFYKALDDDEVTDNETNNASAVLYIEYAGVRFMFTGDIGEEVENFIIDREENIGFSNTTVIEGKVVELSPNIQNIDVLKVSHHGSSGSTTQAFAELVAPDIALIGVGAGNLYGHPSPIVINRLKTANPDGKILRTDEQGSVVIRVSANGQILH